MYINDSRLSIDKNLDSFYQKVICEGTCVAQFIKCQIPNFGSDHDLRTMRSSWAPCSAGSMLEILSPLPLPQNTFEREPARLLSLSPLSK